MSAINGMRPVHPGEILRQELEELGVSAGDLADALGVPHGRIVAILRERDGVSEDIALGLSGYFGTTAQFWLNLQASYERRVAAVDAGDVAVERV